MKQKKRNPRLFGRVSYIILGEKYKNFQRKVDQWVVLAAI